VKNRRASYSKQLGNGRLQKTHQSVLAAPLNGDAELKSLVSKTKLTDTQKAVMIDELTTRYLNFKFPYRVLSYSRTGADDADASAPGSSFIYISDTTHVLESGTGETLEGVALHCGGNTASDTFIEPNRPHLSYANLFPELR
jgi:hypothetical protein